MNKITITLVRNTLQPHQLHRFPALVVEVHEQANLWAMAMPHSDPTRITTGLQRAGLRLGPLLRDKQSISRDTVRQIVQEALRESTGFRPPYDAMDAVSTSAPAFPSYAKGALVGDIALRAVDFIPPERLVRSKRQLAHGLRLARAAEALMGKFSWSGGSGPDPSSGYQVKTKSTRQQRRNINVVSENTTDAFAELIRKHDGLEEAHIEGIAAKSPVTGAQSKADLSRLRAETLRKGDKDAMNALIANEQAMFNCWEAVFVCAAHAGLVTLRQLREVHRRASVVARSVTAKKQEAYMRVLQDYLQLVKPELMLAPKAGHPGDLVFFDNMRHVTIYSEWPGFVFSLWNRERDGYSPNYWPNFDAVPITNLQRATSTKVTISPCPF